MPWILALLLAIAALVLLWLSQRQQRSAGLPAGRVLYADPKVIGAPERPLYDADTHLTGKPDYLVDDHGVIIPVEVKSGWAPPEPHPGHIYQLLAYCLLVERTYEKRPPYGILRYKNRSFTIDYTPEAERELLTLLDEMHAAARQKELNRSHEDRNRCAHCGYRSSCDQRL
ncbi:MAG TPA: PD-(D/E)XK nuclease family protein [Bellilinea sp.]|nr:PD-(D/E)XK nuclease family protein [Bellilinea sp.]